MSSIIDGRALIHCSSSARAFHLGKKIKLIRSGSTSGAGFTTFTI